jgi:predicted RNase H-like HicB family nuclease
MEAMRGSYAIVIERSDAGFGAYVPDLPGCVATAPTLQDTRNLILEAIDLHLEGLQAEALPAPEPSAIVAYADEVAHAESVRAGTQANDRRLNRETLLEMRDVVDQMLREFDAAVTADVRNLASRITKQTKRAIEKGVRDEELTQEIEQTLSEGLRRRAG